MSFLKAILIIGSYQTLILAGIMLTKKHRTRSDIFLAAMFFIYGITLFLGYMEIYNRTYDYPYPFLINTSAPLILLHGPALWFYIKSLTAQCFRFKAKYLLHFVPFLLVLLILIVNNYSLPAAQKILNDSSESFKNDISFPFIIGMIAIFTQGYFIWGLYLINGYKRKIQNYFSEISSMDLSWLRILLITCIVFYAGISLLYIVDYLFSVFSYNVMQSVGYAYASLFILVLGYRGFRQGNVFSSRSVSINLESDIQISEETPATRDKDQLFAKYLLELMEKEKPYLNPDLNLATLASKLNVTPDYLSSVLNGKLNKSFFDFVNYYRVEEFKRVSRLPENYNITIMGMAWDAGFNSKATFNRVFKKTTGYTPGQYLQGLK